MDAARRTETLRAAEVVHIVALGTWATICGLAWPVLAGIVTGTPGAYLATELAWRRGFGAGEHGFAPFAGWFEGAAFWVRTWGWPEALGVVTGAALIAATAAILLFGPRVRLLGAELRLWAAAYAVYLLAVVFPQSSLLRLLFPLSPLWGAVAVPRSPWWRGGVLAVCLLAQWWWIWNMYGLGNQYWQVP